MAAYWAAGFCILATTLQVISTAIAAIRCRARPSRMPPPRDAAPVSVVRPVCGLDNFARETLGSSFGLDYPDYEIIFCAAHGDDPAVPLVRALIAAHPEARARLLIGDDRIGPNPKLNNVVKGFDAARVEQKLRALKLADVEGSALSGYDWVFYLPPRDAYVGVQDTVIKQAIKQEKMSFLKRTTMKSALLVFKPAVKKAVEAMRRGMLYMTVLRADSGFSREDITALTQAYVKVLMPDFKFSPGSERERALAAVEAQKLANEDYAKNPFVAPPRLKEFEPATYAKFEGAYGEPKSKSVSRLTHDADGAYLWQVNQRKAVAFYPAGERLFVAADGRQTIEFKVDEQGDIISVEGRRHRQRWKIPGKLKLEIQKER